MIKIYGIKNCDTVKKALNWLTLRNIEFDFHDYKKHGVDQKKLSAFVDKFGWEKILNSKGTTWRQLEKTEQEKVVDNKSALELMIEKPSIIKRPIIDLGNQQVIGFDLQEFEKMWSK